MLGGNKKLTTSGVIRDENGELRVISDDIICRRERYINDLYRGPAPWIEAESGPKIMKEEVRCAIKRLKNGKASGPDGITREMIKIYDDEILKTYPDLFNIIYKTGQIPENFLRSRIIALPKNHNVMDREKYRTIVLINHFIKIFIRIMYAKVENKINPIIGMEQVGFKKGVGTRNALFILGRLMARSLEMQKEVYLCFLDLSKSSDKIGHEKITQIL